MYVTSLIVVEKVLMSRALEASQSGSLTSFEVSPCMTLGEEKERQAGGYTAV